MMNHTPFFIAEVAQLLKPLRPETPRLWGTMTAPQMLDHVQAGTTLFMAKRMMPLVVPEEKLDRLKAFLMSDKPFMESAPKPEQYLEFETKIFPEFDAQKEAFLKVLATFDHVTRTDADFWCFHPSFGRLNAEETRQLQYKHIRHHFQQFGLMPRQ